MSWLVVVAAVLAIELGLVAPVAAQEGTPEAGADGRELGLPKGVTAE